MLRGFQPCKRRRYCVITLSLIQVQPVLPERRDGGHTDPAREQQSNRSDRLQGVERAATLPRCGARSGRVPPPSNAAFGYIARGIHTNQTCASAEIPCGASLVHWL